MSCQACRLLCWGAHDFADARVVRQICVLLAAAPSWLARLGGLVVLGAVLVEAIAGIRRERRADAMRS